MLACVFLLGTSYNDFFSFLPQLSIAGMWPEVVDGKAVETYKVRKFQGMGKNAREAKYQAAAKGTMSLTKVLPGEL
jgi:hypothetical protein